ncbi:MAG: PAS domain S-box protein [Acidobacteria bacterium]|nr:PAS domain S-box protein [Acidobacteriota bacterium]
MNFDALSLLKKFGLKSVRQKLVTSALLLTGLSILLACVIAYLSFLKIIDSNDNLRKTSQNISETVDLLILENIQYARSLANDPFVKEKVEQAALTAEKLGITEVPSVAQIPLLEERYKQTHTLDDKSWETTEFLESKRHLKGVFERIFFTDRYGLTVGMTSMTDDFVQSDEGWWQKAFKTGLSISDVEFDKQTNTWTMEICVAIVSPKTGQPNGVMKITYNLQDAQDYIARFKQYDSGFAYAVKKDGTVVLHPDMAKRNEPVDDAVKKSGILESNGKNDSGTFAYDRSDKNHKGGESRMLFYQRSTGATANGFHYLGFGWVFVLDNSKDELYAPANSMLKTILLWGAVLFLVFGVLAYLSAESFSATLQQLQDAAEQVCDGNLRARVEIATGDEFERVGDGFNQMLNRLEDMMTLEREQKLSLLSISKAIESCGDAISISDLARDSYYTNKRFQELFGYDAEEMRSQGGLALLCRDPQHVQEVYATISEGGSWTGELEMQTKEGYTVLVEVRADGIRDDEGEIIGRIGVYTDVTEKKRAEKELRASEERFFKTFNLSPQIIALHDMTDGRYIEVNETFLRTLGYQREEVINQTAKKKNIWSEEDREKVHMLLQTSGAFRNLEIILQAKSGDKRVVLLSAEVIELGEESCVLCVGTDVTERKRLEEINEQNLNEFLQLASTVSEGDLTKRGSEGDDAVGRVVALVNKMLEHFSIMVTQVKHIGLSVSSSATEILAAAEQMAVGSQRQADEITNTSSAVEEMAASMTQVSRNAEASADSSKRTLYLAERGDENVRFTVEAMERIHAAVQQTSEKMRLLGKRSSEISEIIDLIEDIAVQTNLLSLNAAIEAAHAGQAGVGFSVVADEIRKLAERSGRATKDVANLIKGVQQETTEALSAMENGMREVTYGKDVAEQARDSLKDISSAISKSSDLIEEISTAADEQARVTMNLASAMQTISSITIETSAGAHETAQTIRGMVMLSEQLNDAISKFKVQNEYGRQISYNPPMVPPANGRMPVTSANYPQGD